MNARYFQKMYDLNPEDWKFVAGVVIEQDKPFVAYGNLSVDEAMGHYLSQCDHCNHHIVHFVLLTNDENTICVGWNCYENTFSQANKLSLDLYRAQKRASAALARLERIEAKNVTIAAHPELFSFLEENRVKNDFCNSLLSFVERFGNLTEKQLAAGYKFMEKANEPKPEEIPAKDAPTGKVQGIFTVLSVKYYDNQWGGSLKMLLQHKDDGYKVFCTVPSSINAIERGEEINLQVTLTPSDDDPKFAYGKRPKSL